MIKSVMNCTKFCEGCRYWVTDITERTSYAGDECAERFIIVSCKFKNLCDHIIEKAEEERAKENGIL